MKIIRPMDLTADGVVESNAPGDGYTQWQPLGRENRFYDESTIISVAQNLVAARGSEFNPDIRIFDLTDGSLQKTITGIFQPRVDEIAMSPDGAYIAYIDRKSFSPFDYRVRVIDRVTEQILYTDTAVNTASDLRWSPDSLYLSYLVLGVRARTVPAANWSGAVDTINFLDESDVAPVSTYGKRGFALDSSGNGYCALLTQNSGGTTHQYVAKFSLSTGAYLGKGFISASIFINGVFSNNSTGELIAYGDSPHRVFNASDMSGVSTPSILSGYTIRKMSGSKDGSEVLIQSSSVQPYNRRVMLSDYSALPAFPVMASYSDIQYSLDYAVFLESGGTYDLVDLATNGLVEQTNPTVTAGDIYTYADHNWEALQDNNDRPDLGAVADPATWLDLGFINPLRMFDNKLDSRTTGPSPLVIDITPGMLVNGLALFNLAASSVQVTYTDPVDGVVYDSGEIGLLDNSSVRTWYDFFFEPYSRRSDFARLDLPAYTDGTITITLTNNEGDAAVGEIVAGSIYRIGDAQFGSSAGILDFSRKEQDQFGRFDIVKRRFSKRAEYDAVIDPATGGNIQRTLAQYRAAPVVWIGDESKEETIVYGFFREFDILLDNPAFTAVTITVEGL